MTVRFSFSIIFKKSLFLSVWFLVDLCYLFFFSFLFFSPVSWFGLVWFGGGFLLIFSWVIDFLVDL